MSDQELSELCKEVFEKTQWDEKNMYLCYEWDVNGYRTGEKSPEHYSMIGMEEMEKHIIHPLYSSDYLLEKLPESTERFGDFGASRGYSKGEPAWRFYYQNARQNLVMEDEQLEGIADTPLKALLKLTKALADAGELKL